MTENSGRVDLVAWRESAPRNYFSNASKLRELLERYLPATTVSSLNGRLDSFGEVVATVVEPAVERSERHRELPQLLRYDGVGRRIEQIEFHPDRDVAMRAVWDSGLVGRNLDAGSFERASLFYLLSHVGEGGLACPAVCTIGLARALDRRGPVELQNRFLASLQSNHFAGRSLGSQFLTEVQGGSDVGANEVVARRDEAMDGAWRLSGEKWFCSVADADLFAVTARPQGAEPGTAGLGCFLVPRHVNGEPNGFSIRQLKDKLGTRGLASGEIDFENALAWPIGRVDEGFKIAVEDLLNTSRWLNAVGSTGLMHRAYLEAVRFSHYRSAFARRIGDIPIVREQLATMKVEEHAALSSTMLLTSLVEQIDSDHADESTKLFHRFLVNANKFSTSIAASDVVHQGIELLGGNGTIESFSSLPRLYRDAIVYESWEGTHNVLCAQVHRDAVRLSTIDAVFEWARREIDRSSIIDFEPLLNCLDDLEQRLHVSLRQPDAGGAAFRRQLGTSMRLIQSVALAGPAEASDESRASAELHIRRHYSNDDHIDPRLVDRVLASDIS